MTPTEQDKELREKLWKIFKHDSLASSRAGSPSQKTEEAINSLIIADRKRVALEARLQEVEVSIIELERSDDPRFYSKDEAIRSQRARYTQLKAQQEVSK